MYLQDCTRVRPADASTVPFLSIQDLERDVSTVYEQYLQAARACNAARKQLAQAKYVLVANGGKLNPTATLDPLHVDCLGRERYLKVINKQLEEEKAAVKLELDLLQRPADTTHMSCCAKVGFLQRDLDSTLEENNNLIEENTALHCNQNAYRARIQTAAEEIEELLSEKSNCNLMLEQVRLRFAGLLSLR